MDSRRAMQQRRGTIGLVENAGGEIGHLSIHGLYVESAQAGGAFVIRNEGVIRSSSVSGESVAP